MYGTELDYAYFAANLGWTPEQYGSCTPVQLLFIRKEIEKKTVRDSDLFKSAVQVAQQAQGEALGEEAGRIRREQSNPVFGDSGNQEANGYQRPVDTLAEEGRWIAWLITC